MKLGQDIRAGWQPAEMLEGGERRNAVTKKESTGGDERPKEKLVWHDMAIWEVELGMERR